MGLVTLPEAAFSYVPQGDGSVAFYNQSQFVYPDSIDGGHYLWHFGDGSTSTERNPSHTYPQGGSYTVTLTAVVCNDTSVYAQEVSTVVGIHAIGANNLVLQLIPNPATEKATLQLTSPQNLPNTKIEVFNITGAKVYATTTNLQAGSNNVQLNLANFEKGLYIINLTNGATTLQTKLVKQ